MKVFVTGASGWIGSAAVAELLAAGHEVVGLARSGASAAVLEQQGATVRRGDLDDLGALQAGAEDADAVVHLANKHDWADPKNSDAAERAAVQTFADALVGTGKPLLLASGVAMLAQGRASTEEDASPWSGPDTPRGGAETLALEYVDRGVTTVPVRFAPTVHRSDAGRLVRLALEQATPGLVVHAVAEGAVPSRDIAEAIGRGLGLPVRSVPAEEAGEWFGFIGRFFALDMSSSSVLTQQRLGWTPTGPTLLEDLDAGSYFRG